jgi:hypothetical protein
MPALGYLPQLFNADTCHTYIQALRWKDRPLQCPRYHSHDVRLWGTYHYRPGFKRYWEWVGTERGTLRPVSPSPPLPPCVR